MPRLVVVCNQNLGWYCIQSLIEHTRTWALTIEFMCTLIGIYYCDNVIDEMP